MIQISGKLQTLGISWEESQDVIRITGIQQNAKCCPGDEQTRRSPVVTSEGLGCDQKMFLWEGFPAESYFRDTFTPLNGVISVQ